MSLGSNLNFALGEVGSCELSKELSACCSVVAEGADLGCLGVFRAAAVTARGYNCLMGASELLRFGSGKSTARMAWQVCLTNCARLVNLRLK
jgi:hypothetical protein